MRLKYLSNYACIIANPQLVRYITHIYIKENLEQYCYSLTMSLLYSRLPKFNLPKNFSTEMKNRSTYTEFELVLLLKNNNREAFEYLYDRYSPALFGIILKIVKDEEKAADVMQDSFLKIWKNMGNYNSEKGSLFTWILNVTRNTAIDKLRVDVKTQMSVSWENVKEIDFTPTVIYNPSPSTIDLRAIVEKLLPEKKLLIEMVYFQGYTHEEVSERLSIPLGTVKSRIRKSLQELRDIFGINVSPVLQMA